MNRRGLFGFLAGAAATTPVSAATDAWLEVSRLADMTPFTMQITIKPYGDLDESDFKRLGLNHVFDSAKSPWAESAWEHAMWEAIERAVISELNRFGIEKGTEE